MFTRDELQPLLSDRTGPAVSIFLPTHVAGREIRQDPIRLKNLLSEAQAALVGQGMRSTDADALLKPGYALLEDALFWRHQQQGLALFINPEGCIVHRLPVPVDESWQVGERFQIRPLLPALAADGRFVVMAVSLKRARIYEGSRHGLQELAPEDLPRGMDNLFNGGPDELGTGQMREDGTVRKPVTANSADAPAYAESGSQKQVSNDEAIQYLKQLSGMIDQYLGGSGVPLVLVADERLAGHFRQICRYKDLVETVIPEPPGALDETELHARAYALVKPLFDRARQEALDRINARLGDGSGQGTTDPAQIVTAAMQGRVDSLLLRRGAECWGRWLPDMQTTVLHHGRHEGDQDLLDVAAVHTLAKDGRVFEVEDGELPAGTVMAAGFRF